MRKTNRNNKYCPFLDKPCLGKECNIYHGRFDRCALGLMADNLYFLTKALNDFRDNLTTRPDEDTRR